MRAVVAVKRGKPSLSFFTSAYKVYECISPLWYCVFGASCWAAGLSRLFNHVACTILEVLATLVGDGLLICLGLSAHIRILESIFLRPTCDTRTNKKYLLAFTGLGCAALLLQILFWLGLVK